MVIYSHSRLQTFEQCALKFKFQYIDKLEPEIKQTIEQFLGIKVHEVLEWIYQEVAENQIPELDQAIAVYIRKWNNEFNNEIKIIKEEFTAEHYFNKGIKFLINYFDSNYPFKDNTIAIEKRVFINLDKQGEYKLQGYIDRLVHNPETNIFEIHDYKTGNFLKSQKELDHDRQLALYSLGIRENYPHAEDVHLIWHFLEFNQKIISKRTKEQLENLKQEIIQLINKIESTTDFQPNPCILCKWCGFRCYCPLFKKGYRDLSKSH